MAGFFYFYRMLLTTAIGDSYGLQYEFVPEIIQNDGRTYRSHPKYPQPPGTYSDDTQMSMAIAEAMLELNPSEWSAEIAAEYFFNTFKRDPRQGYSSRMYEVLSSTNTVTEFRAGLDMKSTRNGAAMRAPLIGLYKTVDEVMLVAEIQAKVTHDTPEGVNSAQAAALMFHGIKNQKEPSELLEYLQLNGVKLTNDPDERSGMNAIFKVLDVLKSTKKYLTEADAFLNQYFTSVLVNSVALGGDTDTVCAIAMPCAFLLSCRQHSMYRIHLLKSLESGLENKEYGKDYIKRLDLKLFAKFLPKLKIMEVYK